MPDPMYTRRRRGSARFDPYYKVQTYDPRSMTWRDVQRSHPTAQSAADAFPPGERCRVMLVTMDGRRPVDHPAPSA